MNFEIVEAVKPPERAERITDALRALVGREVPIGWTLPAEVAYMLGVRSFTTMLAKVVGVELDRDASVVFVRMEIEPSRPLTGFIAEAMAYGFIALDITASGRSTSFHGSLIEAEESDK